MKPTRVSKRFARRLRNRDLIETNIQTLTKNREKRAVQIIAKALENNNSWENQILQAQVKDGNTNHLNTRKQTLIQKRKLDAEHLRKVRHGRAPTEESPRVYHLSGVPASQKAWDNVRQRAAAKGPMSPQQEALLERRMKERGSEYRPGKSPADGKISIEDVRNALEKRKKK